MSYAIEVLKEKQKSLSEEIERLKSNNHNGRNDRFILSREENLVDLQKAVKDLEELDKMTVQIEELLKDPRPVSSEPPM